MFIFDDSAMDVLSSFVERIEYSEVDSDSRLEEAIFSMLRDIARLDPLKEDRYFKTEEQALLLRHFFESVSNTYLPQAVKMSEFLRKPELKPVDRVLLGENCDSFIDLEAVSRYLKAA